MNADAVARVFNDTFAGWDVVMEGGADEPLYVPGRPATLRFTRDFAASALHEAAHWCIAGRRRRAAVDFGYWYTPPPRRPMEARAFMRAESSVQALEAIFAEVAGVRFVVSADDVEMRESAQRAFAAAIDRGRVAWLTRGLPPRARAFRAALWRARRGASVASHDTTTLRSRSSAAVIPGG